MNVTLTPEQATALENFKACSFEDKVLIAMELFNNEVRPLVKKKSTVGANTVLKRYFATLRAFGGPLLRSSYWSHDTRATAITAAKREKVRDHFNKNGDVQIDRLGVIRRHHAKGTRIKSGYDLAEAVNEFLPLQGVLLEATTDDKASILIHLAYEWFVNVNGADYHEEFTPCVEGIFEYEKHFNKLVEILNAITLKEHQPWLPDNNLNARLRKATYAKERTLNKANKSRAIVYNRELWFFINEVRLLLANGYVFNPDNKSGVNLDYPKLASELNLLEKGDRDDIKSVSLTEEIIPEHLIKVGRTYINRNVLKSLPEDKFKGNREHVESLLAYSNAYLEEQKVASAINNLLKTCNAAASTVASPEAVNIAVAGLNALQDSVKNKMRERKESLRAVIS